MQFYVAAGHHVFLAGAAVAYASAGRLQGMKFGVALKSKQVFSF